MRLGVLRRALAVGALAVAGALGPTTAAQAASSRTVIVIGNSTYTISFNGTITGLQALQMVASAETLQFGGKLGAAVCKINGVGNAATSGTCLLGPGGAYWRYFRAAPGASGWAFSSTGASNTTVTDSAVEGWYYGASGSPPFHSFCSVAGCEPPAPVTTVPPVATTGGSGNGSGTTSTSTKANGAPAVPGVDVTTTSTSAPRGAEPDEVASGSPQGGRPEITANEKDDGSPIGVAVAGGVVIALGGTGVWLRRRRVAR
ncbi:MAG: hypothetical protein EXQ79_06615 [Acidimicrobiia bacterium]|nr:hypothetical protein [Acidimicrobiia bacterium]